MPCATLLVADVKDGASPINTARVDKDWYQQNSRTAPNTAKSCMRLCFGFGDLHPVLSQAESANASG